MFWKLVEKFRIVEMKEGSVFKTQSLGYDWVPIAETEGPDGIVYASPSTRIPAPWFKRSTEKPKLPDTVS